MNKILKIGFDFDGVIVDHHETKRKLMAEGDIVLERWQTNSNIIKQFVPLDFYRKQQKRLYGEETLNSLPVEFIGNLMDKISNHNIYLISARHRDSENFAKKWIFKNLNGKFKENHINFCANEKIKVDKINSINPDFFIDDKIKILRNINPCIKKIFFDPDNIHNRLNILKNENIIVIHSLKEFLKTVKI